MERFVEKPCCIRDIWHMHLRSGSGERYGQVAFRSATGSRTVGSPPAVDSGHNRKKPPTQGARDARLVRRACEAPTRGTPSAIEMVQEESARAPLWRVTLGTLLPVDPACPPCHSAATASSSSMRGLPAAPAALSFSGSTDVEALPGELAAAGEASAAPAAAAAPPASAPLEAAGSAFRPRIAAISRRSVTASFEAFFTSRAWRLFSCSGRPVTVRRGPLFSVEDVASRLHVHGGQRIPAASVRERYVAKAALWRQAHGGRTHRAGSFFSSLRSSFSWLWTCLRWSRIVSTTTLCPVEPSLTGLALALGEASHMCASGHTREGQRRTILGTLNKLRDVVTLGL